MAAAPVRPAIPPAAPTRRFEVQARTYQRVALVALGMLCVIVVTGAAVRLSGSGLGCSSWPNCEPSEFIAVGHTNQAIEQLNRLFTGLVSLAVIAAVLGAVRRVPYRRDLVLLAWGLVAGVVAQIVLGGITVLSQLHPVAVAGHFVLSQALVLDATVLLWRSGHRPGPLRPVVGATVIGASRLAMCLGAVVICLTGPLMAGSGPHAGDDWEAVRRFELPIPTAARIHGASAWAFLAAVVFTLVVLARSGAPRSALLRGQVLAGMIVAQGALGYLQYDRGIPAWLVALHVAGATGVVIAATWFHIGLFEAQDPGDLTSRDRLVTPMVQDPSG